MTPETGVLALSLKALSKRFRAVTALDAVSLNIQPGTFVALLGPSGSGKTTMLRLLAGFDTPSSGQIEIAGKDVSYLPPAERNIGMVFQHYALFPHLNVARNIEYGLKMRGWTVPARKKRVAELLSMVRLEALAERMPRQLSGGQQQRIAIARALAYSPSILLMDEPLGALDRGLRLDMAEEIRRIHRSLKTTFIYVTHDREEAMTLADRVLILNDGRIVADGSAENLYQRPTSPFVAGFFSGMNVLTAPCLHPGGADKVGVPPGAVRVTRPDGPHLTLEVQLLDRLFLGDKVQLLFSCASAGTEIVVHVPTAEAPDKAADDSIRKVFIREADIIRFAGEPGP